MYTPRKTSAPTVALALMLALLIGAFALFGAKPASAETSGDASGDGIEPTLIPKSVINDPERGDLGLKP